MKSTAKDVYREIRHRMICGVLGPGMHVSELGFSKELRTGRGAVREAIGKLASDGLLERVQNVGAFVKEPTRKEIEELYEIRQWHEGEVAAKAATRITPRELKELERYCEFMRAAAEHRGQSGVVSVADKDQEMLLIADLNFHLAMARASGNQRAVRFLVNEHILSRVWGEIVVPGDSRDYFEIVNEHLQIIEALRKRDSNSVRQLVRDHVAKGCRLTLEQFDNRENHFMDSSASDVTSEEFERRLRLIEQRHGSNGGAEEARHE